MTISKCLKIVGHPASQPASRPKDSCAQHMLTHIVDNMNTQIFLRVYYIIVLNGFHDYHEGKSVCPTSTCITESLRHGRMSQILDFLAATFVHEYWCTKLLNNNNNNNTTNTNSIPIIEIVKRMRLRSSLSLCQVGSQPLWLVERSLEGKSSGIHFHWGNVRDSKVRISKELINESARRCSYSMSENIHQSGNIILF